MNTLKKSFAIAVILLFIGVAFTPSINISVIKASTNNDFIDVTSEACGIKGFGNTTVKLTKQQYQDLEHYLVEFRARLNQTTTREEAVPIFNEAVVELDKYGLLPRGMSVEQAQKLVTGENKIKRNYFCLVAGVTSYCHFFGSIYRLPIRLFVLTTKLFDIFPNIPLRDIIELIYTINAYWLSMIASICYRDLSGIKILNYASFGVHHHEVWDGYKRPAEGWVISYGLFGPKIWINNFWGNISTISIGFYPIIDDYYIGMAGFTGIVINAKNGTFFLGTALHVNIQQV